MPISTRQRIIEYLTGSPGATPSEIARKLHLTAADIRYHLAELEKAGMVAPSSPARPAGRGRPSIRYQLTPLAQEHNLGDLAGVLLTVCLCAADETKQPGFVQEIASRLAGEHQHPLPSLTHRLNRAVKRLNVMHYHARWEAHAAAPRLFLTHCPYLALRPGHPELCVIDHVLVEQLVEMPVRWVACQADGRSSACVLALGAAPSPPSSPQQA